MKQAKILFVEDDVSLGFLTREFLQSEGFEVTLCEDGESGLHAFQKADFDLCLLDVMLPKMDGFTLGKEIRKQNARVPLFFLTAKNMKDDKFTGFDLGADDYMTKPFDEDELLWRMKAILNRSAASPQEPEEKLVQIGQFGFCAKNQELRRGEEVIRLTERESKVLEVFCRNMGNLTHRKELLEEIWGENDYFAGRSLDVFIAKIRKYLKPDPKVVIENVPRVGFILKVEE